MKEEKEIEFEQYKLFIESAEKTSDKRIKQNNIYLTINLAFISYISTQNFDIKQTIIMIIIGILICAIWFCTINNYSKRNKIKFEIDWKNYQENTVILILEIIVFLNMIL